MQTPVPLSALCAFFALISLSATAAKAETTTEKAMTLKTIAVADFTGADKELGRFIAETLLTDLTRSSKLTLVERNEIKQAFQEMKLQSTGLTEPSQVKKLGKLLSADGLIVGSFLQRDNTLTINARLLDVRTGKLAPGGSANDAGARDNLLTLVDRLASKLHKSLTGEPLPLNSNADDAPPPSDPIPEGEGGRNVDSSGDPKVAFLEELKLQAAAPKNAKLNTLITERDLDKLVRWQMLQFPRQDQTPLTVSKPNSPITRARVLAALIKVALPSDHIARFRGVGDDRLTTDARTIPIWARAYVAAAIEERWWSPQMRVQANQSASWALAVAILTRMPVETNAETVQPSGAKYPERGAITGIILEAEGLPLERAMGPRILDEDGNVVYPLPNTTNDFDKLLDKGLMDYCESEAQAQKRAGRNPLVIRALDLIAPAHHDIIISRADADRIREENKRGRFLQRWAVSVISRSR